MSKTFVTSDSHFGHANIIKYCNRPFQDVHTMDEWIINRWNSRVTNVDIVYFLGDFAFASIERIIEIFDRLNFSACFIVPGNHDEKILGHYAHPFYCVISRVQLIEEIHETQIDGKRFVMCHYPMLEWNQSHRGSISLHGHKHTQLEKDRNIVKTMIDSRRYDIGVDMYGGPVQLTGDLRFLNNPKGWKL